jgi:3-hydroxyisobutyrate dehydrogenase
MLRKIGFIGLGTVGRHMAANLTKGSYELTVYDSDQAAVAEVVAGCVFGCRSCQRA